MMRKLLIFVVAAVAFLTNQARAADFSGMAKIPILVNVIILIGSIACLTTAIKLFSLVKGGSLARGWQLLVISFITLAVGQIFVLAEKLGLFTLTFDIVGLMYMATVGLWLVSLLQTRKVLG